MQVKEKHAHDWVKTEQVKIALKNADNIIVGHDVITYKVCDCGNKAFLKVERQA